MHKIQHVLLASAAALSLAAFAPASAHADGAAAGSITLLGKTLCFPDAPATAHCDLRASAPPPGTSFELLGKTYCFGPSSVVQCDVRTPAGASGTGGLTRLMQELRTRLSRARPVRATK